MKIPSSSSKQPFLISFIVNQNECDEFKHLINKEIDIDVSEVPVVLFELHENSLLYMDSEEWDKALMLLQKAQALIEQLNIENFKRDRLIIVIIFHNTALWHQMLGNLEEAAIFLETAVLNLEILSLLPEFQQIETKNHSIYLEGLLRMQLWALFSQLQRHREALYHAQIAVRISHYMIRDLKHFVEALHLKEISMFNETMVDKTQQYKRPNKESGGWNLSILQRNYLKMMPVIKELHKSLVREEGESDPTDDYLIVESSDEEDDSENILPSVELFNENSDLRAQNNKGNYNLHRNKIGNISVSHKMKNNQLDWRNMLGFMNQNLYHDYLNITNIMKLKRLDFRDVYSVRSTDLTITRENLIERIMILITSYFWMGTELRFLKQKRLEGFEDSMDAEYWHGKALEISVKFLPGDCPLVRHIVASYKKNHSPSNEPIPEDNEVVSDVLMIKPMNGVEIQKVTPIIKKTNNPTVRLSPLDLEPNDYLSEFQINAPSNTHHKVESNELLESKIKLSSREENSKAENDLFKSVSNNI